MKLLAFVLASLVLTGVSALGVQSMTANQRQDSAEQFSGTPITNLKTIRITSKRLGEQRMEDRQLIAFTEMMNAVNAGDAKSYARLYAQDAVITIYGGDELKGRGAIEQYEVNLLREFPGARLAFYSVWQKAGLAVVHYGVNGRTPGGQLMGHEGLLFYRFEPSGLIAEERRYLDSLTPMAQMGLLGATPARALPTLPTAMKVHVANGSAAEETNIATVRASFAALDSKDESGFFATLGGVAVFDELINPRPLIGSREIHTWFEAWTTAVPDATTEITNILGVGEFVLVESVLRGTLKGPLGRLFASDRPFAVHRAAIVQVRGGKLCRISAFMNGKELAEAVGQWPPHD